MATEGKRWLHRRKLQLEAELQGITAATTTELDKMHPSSIHSSIHSNGSGAAADSVPPNDRMTCIAPKRCLRTRSPASPDPMAETASKYNPYGTFVQNGKLEDTTKRKATAKPTKRKRVKESDEEEGDEEDDAEEGEGDEDDVPHADVPKLDLDSEDYCSQCNIPMKVLPHRALLVCTQCGCVSSYIDSTTSSMAYGEEIDFSQQYSYRRANHWKLAIAQLQAIENTEIKQGVLDKILQELYQQDIVDPVDVTPKLLRDILKKLKLRKCYDHIPQIYARITGIPPVRFTPEIEERFRLLFIAIQEPFAKVAPSYRKNFLSYRYLLHKVSQLCGYDDLLAFCPCLKGREKLIRQDSIYRGICEELNWQFIPSL